MPVTPGSIWDVLTMIRSNCLHSAIPHRPPDLLGGHLEGHLKRLDLLKGAHTLPRLGSDAWAPVLNIRFGLLNSEMTSSLNLEIKSVKDMSAAP